MKKTLLLCLMLLGAYSMQAQNFQIENANDATEVYQNGTVYTTGELGDLATETGFMRFKVRNISNDTIKVRAEFVEAVNSVTDAYDQYEAVQFCFAFDCYTDLVLNRVYPTDNLAATIAPSDTHRDDDFDHIANFYHDPQGGVVSYKFRFFEVDDNLDQVGDSYFITYKYDPTLSVEDFSADFAQVKSIVKDATLEVQLNQDAEISVYDMLGRKVFETNAVEGTHQFALPKLTSGLYIIKLEAANGASQTQKIQVR